MPDQDDTALYIDGQPYTVDDLTFREQRTMRGYVRELAPGGDEDEAGEADLIPAMIAVVKQRDDKDFTLEQALDFKPADVEPPEPPKRPTRRTAKA